jgi:DNA-binding NarL/FixJ family response regulator
MASLPPTGAGSAIPRLDSPGPQIGDGRPARVLLVDEQRMFTDAMWRFLAAEPGLEPVAAADTLEGAMAECLNTSPDVVLVDVDMSDGQGVDAIRRITSAAPAAVVIVVTAGGGAEGILAAVRAGARGYVPKTRSAGELASVVRRALAGEIVLAPGDVPAVIGHFRRDTERSQRARSAFGRLTAREVEILTLLSSGRSTAQIAGTLHISPLTVRSHVKNILPKLGVHSKVEAVAYAITNGLIETIRSA